VVQHAEAKHVSVLLERRRETLVVVVEDDGQGFDLSAVRASALEGRLGVAGMEERASLLGGSSQSKLHPAKARRSSLRSHSVSTVKRRGQMLVLRLLLADDHGVLRAGLRALLDSQPDMRVVGEAETADEAVLLAQRLQPNIALVDVRMPGGGLDALRRMKQHCPELKVLIMSQYDDTAYLHQALAMGASGYALKRAAGQELVHAIRTVARDEVYLHPTLTRVLVEESWGPRQPESAAPDETLSERETQVLRLVALGYTTRQIADELSLSVRTVETYKQRFVDKLGLRGRAALVRYALEHGLLEAESEH
jgi:DNA-binding NarL/FixJ family response regulator